MCHTRPCHTVTARSISGKIHVICALHMSHIPHTADIHVLFISPTNCTVLSSVAQHPMLAILSGSSVILYCFTVNVCHELKKRISQIFLKISQKTFQNLLENQNPKVLRPLFQALWTTLALFLSVFLQVLQFLQWFHSYSQVIPMDKLGVSSFYFKKV